MRFVLAAAVAAVSLCPAAVSAQVLYENGSLANQWGGNNPEAQGYYVAEHFSLGSSASLGKFVFNAYTYTDTVPTTDVNLRIYADGGAAGPGAILYSGDFSVASTAVVGNVGYDLTDFTVNLPSWNLGAGDYYVGLNVQPSQWNMHWTLVNGAASAGRDYISGSGDTGTFGGYGLDHYFRFEAAGAVPEPTSWAMMVGGFGLMGAAMRRRKVSATFA